MKALLLYVCFLLVGVAIAFYLGTFVERQFGSAVSLLVFVALFFTNFAVSWILVILCMDGNLSNAQGGTEQRVLESAYRKINKGR